MRFWWDWYSFLLIVLEPLFIPAVVDSGTTRHPGASSTTGTSSVNSACTKASFRGLRCLGHLARKDGRQDREIVGVGGGIESYQEI